MCRGDAVQFDEALASAGVGVDWIVHDLLSQRIAKADL